MSPSDATPVRELDLPSRASVIALMGDDLGLADQLIALLAQQTPQLLQKLASAVADGNARDAGRHAHTLRGMLSNFGAQRACAAADALEHCCKDGGNWSGASAAYAQLQAQVQAVLRALR